MIRTKTLLLVSSVLALSSCGTVGGLFGSGEKEKPPLEGERISVLELQKTLTADKALDNTQQLALPDTWTNTSWPQAGGYPNHSMQNISFDRAEISRAWSADIGSGSTDELPLTASPVVAQGMIFTLDTDSNLSAFNTQNGKHIWKTDVEHEDEDEAVISGGISYAHETLFVTNGYDEILAVGPNSGDILWRSRLPAPSRAAPTVIGGRVFVSTIDSRLVALSAKDGSSLWEYTGVSETAGLLGAASPGANNDIVVPTFSSGEITALRVENGSVAWSDNLSNVKRYGGGLESLSDIKAMPVLDRGVIVAISFGGKLAAIDERTGTRIWQREIAGAQTPWVAGGYVFVLSSENQIIALSITDGSIYWIAELQQFEDEEDKEDPITWAGPVMIDDHLILAGSNGKMVEIDARTGDITRNIKTKKNVQIAPIVAEGTLYILAEDGTLVAYR